LSILPIEKVDLSNIEEYMKKVKTKKHGKFQVNW